MRMRAIGANYLKDILAEDQAGIILVLVLLMTVMLSMVAVAMISTGTMNFKVSHYDLLAQQAQMGCDAGVDWVREIVFAELNEPQNVIAYELPMSLAQGNQSVTLNVANDFCNVMVGPITRQTYPSPNTCQYEFAVTAEYEGATKQALVKVVYDFDGGQTQLDSMGNPLFVPRQYINRGHILVYQTNY